MHDFVISHKTRLVNLDKKGDVLSEEIFFKSELVDERSLFDGMSDL